MKETLEKGQIIPISKDYIFTEIFNSEDTIYVLEWFISAYLNKKIEKIRGNIKLLSRKLKKDNKGQARNEVDLLVIVEGEIYNIELNNSNKLERNIVFASKIHSRSIKKGDMEYSKMNKTIQINLNNYRCNKENLIEEYNLRNKQGEKLTEKLQIDQIDMVKAKEICYCNNEREEKIRKWCLAINAKTSMDLKNYLGDIMSKEDSDKLVKKIEEMSVEEQYANIYIEAEKYISADEMARNTELALEREKAKEEGKNEGIEKGMKKGIEKGIKKGKKETAKNLLSMNISIEDISKATGLSIKEIELLK